MTARLEATFARLRERGERALVPYFTAGDPSLADTRCLVAEAARRGADVIELGVPFSDPLADGPVIQRAAMRALAAGTTLPRLLQMVSELRAEVSAMLMEMGDMDGAMSDLADFEWAHMFDVEADDE